MTGSRPEAADAPPEELVRRAARGDTAAFARLVRLHHTDMTRVAFVVTGDVDAAVWATGAAWPVAWQELRRGRSSDGLGGWLCSLAADEAVVLVRSDGVPGAEGLVARAQPARPEPARPEPARPEGDPELARAIASLDAGDRALLALRYVAGLSVAELERLNRRSRPSVAERLGRLARDVGGPAPASGLATAERWLGERLLAYARVPVWPVDADAAARRARATAADERTRLVSIAVSAVIGVLITGLPYWVILFHGH